MGKGSGRRKGDDPAAYRDWYDEYAEANNMEAKKKTECWKCNDSWRCKNKYKSPTCLGLEL